MIRVFRYVAYDMRYFLRKNSAHIALIASIITVLLLAQAVVASGMRAYAIEQRTNSALKLIEVRSYSAHNPSAELTDGVLKEIERIEWVERATPYWQFDIEIADEANWASPTENPAPIWATPCIPELMPRLIAGEEQGTHVQEGNVILPNEVPGGTLEHLMGATIDFTSTRVDGATGSPYRYTLKVQGIYDNSSYNSDGSAAAYLNVEDMRRISEETRINYMPYMSAYVVASSEEHVESVQQALAEQGLESSSIATQMRELGGFFSILERLAFFFNLFLALVAILIGLAVSRAWMAGRYRTIGTLRAVGWKRHMIVAVVALELLILGIVASLAGIAVGCLLSLGSTAIIAGLNLTYLPVAAWTIPPVSALILPVIVVPVLMVIGGIAQAMRMARISPDVALRHT